VEGLEDRRVLRMGGRERKELPIRWVVGGPFGRGRQLVEIFTIASLRRDSYPCHLLLTPLVGQDPLQEHITWPGLTLPPQVCPVLVDDPPLPACIDEDVAFPHNEFQRLGTRSYAAYRRAVVCAVGCDRDIRVDHTTQRDCSHSTSLPIVRLAWASV